MDWKSMFSHPLCQIFSIQSLNRYQKSYKLDRKSYPIKWCEHLGAIFAHVKKATSKRVQGSEWKDVNTIHKYLLIRISFKNFLYDSQNKQFVDRNHLQIQDLFRTNHTMNNE